MSKPKRGSRKADFGKHSHEKFKEEIHTIERIPWAFNGMERFIRGKASPDVLQELRLETMRRIEKHTGRPLIVFASKLTGYVDGEAAELASIQTSDMEGFTELVNVTQGSEVDVLISSNGGDPTAAERIVNLLRGRYSHIRYIVVKDAYSAATMICFSGNEILMDDAATLGPIDPQVGGIPTHAILSGFEAIEKRIRDTGPEALPAYLPLLEKYSPDLLEYCRIAEALSKDLARGWLRQHMFPSNNDVVIDAIIDAFANYSNNKAHSRSFDLKRCQDLNLMVTDLRKDTLLWELGRSLAVQHMIFFGATPFVKLFECVREVSWGRARLRETIGLVPSASERSK